MARQEEGKENIRKIQQSGDMYTVSIPIELMRELGWREHQKVVIERDEKGDGLKIKDWEEKNKS